MVYVCAQHGHLITKLTLNFQRVEVPCVRESCPEALASRKLATGESSSEGSETAKPGSNEQELDIEAVSE